MPQGVWTTVLALNQKALEYLSAGKKKQKRCLFAIMHAVITVINNYSPSLKGII